MIHSRERGGPLVVARGEHVMIAERRLDNAARTIPLTDLKLPPPRLSFITHAGLVGAGAGAGAGHGNRKKKIYASFWSPHSYFYH